MAEVTIPTAEEIEQLPRWARVAFAARCARRVLPLFIKHWPDAPKKHVDAVTNAVEIAEQSAAIASHVYVYNIAFNSACDAAVEAADNDATHTAAHAAFSAAYATAAANAEVDAVDAAANADPASIPHIRHDFEIILKKSRLEKWTDDTPVPPSLFGPLDDIENDEHVVMALRAFGEPGVSASTLAEQMLAVYKALNVYTLAKYGKHLSRGEFRRLVLQNAGVPA